MLCVSGKITWCRLAQKKNQNKSKAIKSTPISFITRINKVLWNTLRNEINEPEGLRDTTQTIFNNLTQYGASFFDDIVHQARLLKTQVDDALAELVALGKVTNDSFEGLRAFLIPIHKRKKKRAGFQHTGRWSALQHCKTDEQLNDEQIEELIYIYLARWGIIFRKILEKEINAPQWRLMLRVLRRLELKGLIRGGRFIAGINGEQFAKTETVTLLRNIAKKEKQAKLISISAADPLNLIGIIIPGNKVSRIASNRILFRDGIPIAVYEANEFLFLEKTPEDKQWEIKQALIRACF